MILQTPMTLLIETVDNTEIALIITFILFGVTHEPRFSYFCNQKKKRERQREREFDLKYCLNVA